MTRSAKTERTTRETRIQADIAIDGGGRCKVTTGIGFFNHMLTLFCVHGSFDLNLSASGDLDVDYHHTVEDVGLVIGGLLTEALGDRKSIFRYGHAVIPMDDALAEVAIDLSNRPYLVFRADRLPQVQNEFDASLAKEFFRALSQRAGMNLHIRIAYGENWHHMVEAVFKGFARALRQAVTIDPRVKDIPSSKGIL